MLRDRRPRKPRRLAGYRPIARLIARLRKQPVPGAIMLAMAALFRWPGAVMTPRAGPARVRVAAVIPAVLLVLFTGLAV
jgi:hypothetical protein